MASTFTQNKGIEQPAAGSYNDTWATPVNADWSDIDNAFGGKTTINVSGVVTGNYTLILSQYQPPNIVFTGTITGTLAYLLPAGVGGIFTVYNNTTGGGTLAFGVASSGMTISQGQRTLVVSDGVTISVAQSAASAAGPSALVGLTPIVGSASTFMASDSAPALNQAIAPTWTGSHTFNDPPILVNGAYLQGTFQVNSSGIIDATGGGLECKTAPVGSANSVAASTAFVAASFALIDSQTFTGTPKGPTPPTTDRSTRFATTTFVNPNNSLVTAGFQVFAGGLIIQWGRSAGGSSPQSVLFPIAFPTTCFTIVCTPSTSSPMSYAVTNPGASVSGFSIYASDVDPCSWIAIGN